jgi:hypothetical protein
MRQKGERMTGSEECKAPEFCELCGSPGGIVLGGRMICQTYYEGCGSCCTEFQEVDEDAERIKRIAREVARQSPCCLE